MFSAYHRIGENRYRQRIGLDFEDFAIGQRFRHRPGVTLSQQDNADEATGYAERRDAALRRTLCRGDGMAASADGQHAHVAAAGRHDQQDLRQAARDPRFR